MLDAGIAGDKKLGFIHQGQSLRQPAIDDMDIVESGEIAVDLLRFT